MDGDEKSRRRYLCSSPAPWGRRCRVGGMCGRYTFIFDASSLQEAFGLVPPGFTIKSGHNLGPGQYIVIVRPERGQRVADLAHWGLIPGWVKDPNAFSGPDGGLARAPRRGHGQRLHPHHHAQRAHGGHPRPHAGDPAPGGLGPVAGPRRPAPGACGASWRPIPPRAWTPTPWAPPWGTSATTGRS